MSHSQDTHTYNRDAKSTTPQSELPLEVIIIIIIIIMMMMIIIIIIIIIIKIIIIMSVFLERFSM